MEPATSYEFRGSVWAADLQPARTPFHGASFLVAELDAAGPPEELLGADMEAHVQKRHTFLPTAAGHPTWMHKTARFQTGTRTRALLVVCVFGGTEDVVAGSARFKDVELRRIPDEQTWTALARRAARERRRPDEPPADWRAERLVGNALGGELRPSIACLPGERLRMLVRLPDGTPRLSTGLGVWAAALIPDLSGELSFVVRVDGEELLREPVTVPQQAIEGRWHDVDVDLSRWAGEQVALELAVEGSVPGVFGAPTVLDTGHRSDAWNVLLISIDTLRADHVGCYGYDRETTPKIDAFAAEAVRFADVTAQAPYTLPSHVSMLSGQLPSVHGVLRGGQFISGERTRMIAEILAAEGYATQAFGAGGFLNAAFGFDRGFDGFTNVDPLRHHDSAYFRDLIASRPEHFSDAVVREHGPERVERWLAEHATQPFFLLVHSYTVHDYDPPAEWLRCAEEQGCTSTRTDFTAFHMHKDRGEVVSDADREHLLHRYDAALRFTDHLVGRLLDRLDALDLRARTIVALTSDHGEEMFERGYIQHGKSLYEELVRVPLILRVPGRAPAVDETPAMVTDLVPTLLARLGLPAGEHVQGVDLFGPRHVPGRQIWSEVDDAFARKFMARKGDTKLIHGPQDAAVHFPNPPEREWELFELAADPREEHNLFDPADAAAQRLRDTLLRTRDSLQTLGDGLGSVGEGTIDEATLTQLAELGYVDVENP